LYPAREDPTKAAGLRLKGIDIVGGDVIIDVQFADPGQVVEHGAGTEASRLPFSEKFVDPWKSLFKYFPAAIQPSVMIQVVDDYLEAPLHERAAQPLRSLVTERNEAKVRAQTTLLLHVRQLLAMGNSRLGLHVMRQHHREPLAARPSGESGRRSPG